MSNRLTFEFAVKVRNQPFVQLDHKTYEPAREKAEERGETMIHSAEKRDFCRSAEVSVLSVTFARWPNAAKHGSLGPKSGLITQK
jgi:hypothetical protein